LGGFGTQRLALPQNFDKTTKRSKTNGSSPIRWKRL